jgi:chromosome partitioning protein
MMCDPTIVAVVNEKGGVAKTTTTLHVGAALVELGYMVALVGLDPQRDLTRRFRTGMECEKLRFYDATAGNLKSTLRQIRTHTFTSYVLLDCPPNLGPIVRSALQVSNAALVPVAPEALPVEGLGRTMETLEFARDPRRHNSNPDLAWRMLLTLYDMQNDDSFLMEHRLRQAFGDKVLLPTIARHKAIASASLEGLSILQTAPRIHPAGAYRAVARNLVKGWHHGQT